MFADPSDPNTYYCAGWFYDSSYYRMGFGKSTNGGATWTHSMVSASGVTAYPYAMGIDYSHPDTLFIGGYEASSGAIYRSVNGGTSWTKLTATGLAGTVYGIAVRPDNSTVLFAATSSGIYRSTDAGSSFTKMSTAISSTKNVLIDPVTPSTVYVGTNSQGVYRSIDGGATWSAFNTGLTETCINCLAVSPGNFVYAGTNGGSSFRWTLGTGVAGSSTSPLPEAGLRVWPNPSYGSVNIAFELAEPAEVNMAVYDLDGRLVGTPAGGYYGSGEHYVSWDAVGISGEEAPAGVYYVRLAAGDEILTGRLVLIR
jgi:hypothetical protein